MPAASSAAASKSKKAKDRKKASAARKVFGIQLHGNQAHYVPSNLHAHVQAHGPHLPQSGRPLSSNEKNMIERLAYTQRKATERYGTHDKESIAAAIRNHHKMEILHSHQKYKTAAERERLAAHLAQRGFPMSVDAEAVIQAPLKEAMRKWRDDPSGRTPIPHEEYQLLTRMRPRYDPLSPTFHPELRGNPRYNY